MAQVESKESFLTLREAASLSPYSSDYLNLLARKGKIRAYKIGRDWLITKKDLASYLMRQQTETRNRFKQLTRYLNLFN